MRAEKLAQFIKKCLRRNSDSEELDPRTRTDVRHEKMTQSHRGPCCRRMYPAAHAHSSKDSKGTSAPSPLPSPENFVLNCRLCSRLSPDARAPASALHDQHVKVTCCPFCQQPLYSDMCGDPDQHVSSVRIRDVTLPGTSGTHCFWVLSCAQVLPVLVYLFALEYRRLFSPSPSSI